MGPQCPTLIDRGGGVSIRTHDFFISTSRIMALLLATLAIARADVKAGWSAMLTRDYETALKEWLPLARQGDGEAQASIGILYAEGLGVPKDEKEGVRWYRLAAEQGNAAGEFNLGYMYSVGHGVTADVNEALKWFRLSAQQGYASAQHDLGVAFWEGRGVTQDYPEALKWFRLAAGQGSRKSMTYLGRAYREGRGVKQSSWQALTWLLAAGETLPTGEHGDRDAQELLGWMFETGDGAPKDQEEAKKWLNAAAQQGSDYAKRLLLAPDEKQTVAGRTQTIEGVTAGSVLWADWETGEYSFTVRNTRSEDIKNLLCQVVFYDNSGKAIESDSVRFEGVIPAGLPKRLTGKVDVVVHRLTAVEYGMLKDGKPQYAQQPSTKIEVRIVSFDVAP
jgi:TPR repeat protein